MRKSVKVSGILLAILLFACNNIIIQKERQFSFSYSVQLPPIIEIGKDIKLWVPLPQSNNYQTISNLTIESTLPVTQHTESTYGNLMAHVSAESPLPSGLHLTVSFNIIRKEQSASPANLTAEEMKKYLSPSSYVPRDTRFEDIAKTIIKKTNSVVKNGKALYKHILGRMNYDKSGKGWGRGDAIYACDIGKGNCTDFHSLFNAVARTANIPARFLIGFPIPKEESGAIGGYHCWAEFYDPAKGWIPVDISEADKRPEMEDYFFGNLDPNRIMFTLGRDIELVPESSNGPVNFFIYPVLEIDGERSNIYTKSFSFVSVD